MPLSGRQGPAYCPQGPFSKVLVEAMQSAGPQKLHQPTDAGHSWGSRTPPSSPREEEMLCGQVSNTSLRCHAGNCSGGGQGRGRREACGGDAPGPGGSTQCFPGGVGRGGGGEGLPISSCPGYFPLTLCRNVFLSWSSSVVPGQDRVVPGPMQPLQSFRQPFLRVAWGRTERPGSESRLACGKGKQPGGPGGSCPWDPRARGGGHGLA